MVLGKGHESVMCDVTPLSESLGIGEGRPCLLPRTPDTGSQEGGRHRSVCRQRRRQAPSGGSCTVPSDLASPSPAGMHLGNAKQERGVEQTK